MSLLEIFCSNRMMLSPSKCVNLFAIVVLLFYVHVAEGRVVNKNFHKSHNDHNDPEEYFIRHFNRLEGSLGMGGVSRLNDLDIYMLRMLAKKLDEIRTKKEMEMPEFWYSRLGRK